MRPLRHVRVRVERPGDQERRHVGFHDRPVVIGDGATDPLTTSRDQLRHAVVAERRAAVVPGGGCRIHARRALAAHHRQVHAEADALFQPAAVVDDQLDQRRRVAAMGAVDHLRQAHGRVAVLKEAEQGRCHNAPRQRELLRRSARRVRHQAAQLAGVGTGEDFP
ncbi:MAG: hypothetical protein ACREQZ_16225 [Woeseiaceae bacterium]